ncbi:toll-like receptor 2 [Tribolium castaneum]|uniref:Toll-like receptor 2 n=1 Tax=Tribolium castaneum TaxID=7070 RepID=A0A139WDW1_TRICA|nr:PREDICTED: toll-like receptor 2 [Tribolium castaneum]KYB26109.1 Toll-like receptor 2 [Tribolium castaneum]|eukprot:XP_015837871.1 PREDICTED: toll-like receptor 2 [Tribolium castaneum]
MRIFILLACLASTCSENYCPPIWQKPTMTQVNETGSILLGEDEFSGCECRAFPASYSFCYGRLNCRTFPRNITISTKTFWLKASRIPEIKPGDLTILTHLEALTIEGNYNLTRILAGSFLHMKKLQKLCISFNANLKILEAGCFDGLTSLRHLLLVKNAFTKVAQITPVLVNLPKLRKLDLSENQFSTIDNSDFAVLGNSYLYELNMILCQIENIEAQAFTHLRNLTVLRLGENSLNISSLAKALDGTTLKSLNLYSIGLKKNNSRLLLDAIAKTNISFLSLAKNQFEVIKSDTFPLMPKIQTLDLQEVLALNITSNAFVGFPNLKTLLLSGNRLNSIPDGVLLEKLSCFEVKQNSGNVNNKHSYFSLFGEKFNHMKNLLQLDLSFNIIQALYNSSFTGLENLRILGLKSATIHRISNGTFSNLSKLVFLNLENNPFVVNHPLTLESGIFDGLDNLEVLLLGGCGIKFVTNAFKSLKNLVHLGLERNKLMILPNFEGLVKLQTLDLSQNNIKPWFEPIFATNTHLRDVNLGGNKITYLTPAMVRDLNRLFSLELSENPFTCDCSFAWDDPKIMKLIENEITLCFFPDSTTGLTIKEFLSEKPDCHNLLIFILPTVFVFLLISSFVVVLYYFRWHLRYWLFLTRLHLSRNHKIRHRDTPQGHVNYLYDAFVSYSSEDRNFVIRLVTMLENYPPYIKLCVYERDFEVGTMISENVLESVAKSRKTLLLISNSYAKSQWCRWESQIAEHHRLFFQDENGQYVDDSLILIKLGPVNETYMTPTLKYLLKTRIYLQWDEDEKKQKVFWEKLRTALAPPGEINENTYL